MTKTYALMILILSCSLSACGTDGHHASQPTKTSAPASVAEAISRLESSGQIPVLNRDDTVVGPDFDRNGVRDDLDAYIAALPDTSEQKESLKQQARAIALTMTVNLNDINLMNSTLSTLADAVSCVVAQYPGSIDAARVNSIQKFSVNTKQRFMAYEAFNNAASGQAWKAGKGCTTGMATP